MSIFYRYILPDSEDALSNTICIPMAIAHFGYNNYNCALPRTIKKPPYKTEAYMYFYAKWITARLICISMRSGLRRGLYVFLCEVDYGEANRQENCEQW